MAKIQKGQVRKYTFHSQIETKAADDTSRTLVVKISTINPDRSNDVVEPRGVLLDDYMKNPVVALSHNYSDLPIARCKDIIISDTDITATVEFPAEGTYEKADTVYKLYKEGFMNAWSIGFIPEEYSERKDENGYGYTFQKWQLLEFSAVLVPDNPEALTIMRSKGIEVKELGEEGEIKAADDGAGEGDSEDKPDAADNEDEVKPELQVTEMTAAHLSKIAKSASRAALSDYYGTADEDFDTGKAGEAAVVKEGREFSAENCATVMKTVAGMRKHAAAMLAHADMLEKMVGKTDGKAVDEVEEKEVETFRIVEKEDPQKALLNLVEVIKAVDKIAGKGLQEFNKAK